MAEVDACQPFRGADVAKPGSNPPLTHMAQIKNDQASREGQPTHSQDGVDLTLIRWMLSLTPAERLQVLQENVRSLIRLRGDETET